LYVRLRSDSQSRFSLTGLWRSELALVGVCTGLALVLAWLGPTLAKWFLGIDIEGYQTWILVTGLISAMTFGIQCRIQAACALLEWKRACFSFVGLAMVPALAFVVRPMEVQSYLFGALAFYMTLLIILNMRKKIKYGSDIGPLN